MSEFETLPEMLPPNLEAACERQGIPPELRSTEHFFFETVMVKTDPAQPEGNGYEAPRDHVTYPIPRKIIAEHGPRPDDYQEDASWKKRRKQLDWQEYTLEEDRPTVMIGEGAKIDSGAVVPPYTRLEKGSYFFGQPEIMPLPDSVAPTDHYYRTYDVILETEAQLSSTKELPQYFVLGAGSKIMTNARVLTRAVIGDAVTVGPDATIGAYAKLQRGVYVERSGSVDDCAELSPGVRIGPRATVGPMSRLAPRVIVGEEGQVGEATRLEEGVVVEKYAVVDGDVVLGAGSYVGKFAKISRGVRAGRNVRVYANATVDAEATLGNNVIVNKGGAVGYSTKMLDESSVNIDAVVGDFCRVEEGVAVPKGRRYRKSHQLITDVFSPIKRVTSA